MSTPKGCTLSCHLYHYAGNNPVRYTDPDGNEKVPYEVQLKMRNYISSSTYKHTDIYRWASIPEHRIKENFKIDIYRSVEDSGNKGPGNDKYYKSEIHLSYSGKIIFKAMVQSTADHPKLNLDKEHEGSTLEPQIFSAILIGDSPSYGESFILVESYMIHPNKWIEKVGGPWKQPYSLGCQIMRYEDYFKLLEILKAAGFAFASGNKIKDTIKTEIHNAE